MTARKPIAGWVFPTLWAGLLAVDQAVKAWARGALVEGQSLNGPWPGVFELTLTYNKGIAFGLFQGVGVFFAPVAILIAGAAALYSYRHRTEPWPAHVGLALLASGAIGNLIDRVWLGKVTDMFWLRAIDFPVFNVADSCITVGAVLLGIAWILMPADKPEKVPVAQPEPAAESNPEQVSTRP